LELIYIVGVGIVLLGFAAILFARASENRTQEQHKQAKAALESAKSEREVAKIEGENSRALTLSKARDNALEQILSADLQSKNELHLRIGERGGLKASFADGNNDTDKGIPSVSWEWTPFENAVVKIFRNEGAILEDIVTLNTKGTLIHVEPYDAKGRYHDKEAKANKTYNYYAFIETRRTGVRAEPVKLDLPVEMQSDIVIDEYGNEITAFNTYHPQTYEEPFYDGFCYRRITVEKYLDGQAQRKRKLDRKREALELAEEEQELERLERELGLRSGNFDESHIRKLIEEAKRLTERGTAISKAETMLDGMNDVDEREKDIILSYIRRNAYR